MTKSFNIVYYNTITVKPPVALSIRPLLVEALPRPTRRRPARSDAFAVPALRTTDRIRAFEEVP
jgi:hypothetical protein